MSHCDRQWHCSLLAHVEVPEVEGDFVRRTGVVLLFQLVAKLGFVLKLSWTIIVVEDYAIC